MIVGGFRDKLDTAQFTYYIHGYEIGSYSLMKEHRSVELHGGFIRLAGSRQGEQKRIGKELSVKELHLVATDR
jgi:hypothetical protein